jgi:ribosomal protein S4
MRLDLALFYLKISTSLKESKFLIKKGLIYVNQIKITKADFKLDKFSIIEIKGDNNKQVLLFTECEDNMTDRMIEVYKGICRNVRKILIVIVS